ncbi:MAG: spore coat protein U domain-containing protein [Deltaproteobacteria bacterium]|nr:spore coat protein U domain-containing protein [Deltaproteobacteria bacterium]
MRLILYRLASAATVSSLVLAGGLLTARAGAAQEDLAVSASVADNCTIETTPLAFGSYDPITTHAASELAGTGSVTVTCTSGASAVIKLGEGANADGASTPAAPARRLKSGSNFLSYFLFSDTLREVVWGNTALTGVDHTGDGAPAAFTIYGAITAGQNVPSGTYTDTVVATVAF